MSIRDELRKKIFAAENTKCKVVTMNFFGTEIEIRQATIGQIQKMLDRRNETLQAPSLAQYLIDYAYVPGTDEPVFEQGDLENLVILPYNADMQKLSQIITELSSVDVIEAEKNSGETDQSGT